MSLHFYDPLCITIGRESTYIVNGEVNKMTDMQMTEARESKAHRDEYPYGTSTNLSTDLGSIVVRAIKGGRLFLRTVVYCGAATAGPNILTIGRGHG